MRNMQRRACEMRVCATGTEQHNKGVVTPREEFPWDGYMFLSVIQRKTGEDKRLLDHTTKQIRSLTQLSKCVFCFTKIPVQRKTIRKPSDAINSPLLVKQVNEEKEAITF